MDAFDADVLIYAVDRRHPLGRRVRALFDRPSDPGEPIGVGSVLLLSELLVSRDVDNQQEEHEQLAMVVDRLHLVDVDPHLARLAAGYRSRYRLRTVDAVHLATAVEAGADRFITNNSRDFPKTITEIDITYPMGLPAPDG